jgi:hypothetical protein
VPAGPVDASTYVSGLAAAFVVVAFAVGVRAFGASPPPGPRARRATAGATQGSWRAVRRAGTAGMNYLV